MPSVSAAVASMLTLAGAIKVVLFTGFAILIVGGSFTKIFIACEVVASEPLSIAFAVRI